MYKIKALVDKNIAIKVGKFITGPDAFEQTWAPNEKKSVAQAPVNSLSSANHQYWHIEDKGEVIAAVGVRENKCGSNGWEMDTDYLAVHKDYRRQGLATQLMQVVEKFIQNNKGRYLHILSCDISSYLSARKFFASRGYKQVARIPDYYVPGEGRIDFFKKV
jgi:ribosomal protein S18 acetylase RimI-like enzyme